MASKRLLDKRREAEAAEKRGKTKTTKKTARKTTTTRKRRTKAPERKRLLWGVFSGTLKEEGRYAWNEREAAEERLAQLRAKSKKMFFIQPIKEVISDSARPVDEVPAPTDDEEPEDDVRASDDDDAEEDEDDDDDSEE